MRLTVLFFGMLKDVTGAAEDRLELPPGATLRTVFDHYAARYPRLEGLAGSIVLARNHTFAALATPVADGDEVAFLPPVSGGSGSYLAEVREGGHLFALTRGPIAARRVVDAVLRGGAGAVVTFEGTVRNNTRGRATRFLEYECYIPMALREMARIGKEMAGEFAIDRVAIVHRLGRMLVGETSVAVVATAPHRAAAFDAARAGIDRLKRQVPIWKKEFFEDGEVWVEGEWDAHAPVVDRG